MEGVNKAARICQLLIGLVYLISGVIKVLEPILFYWEAIPYVQMLGFGPDSSWQLMAKSAVWLAPIEVGLGVGLLLNWRPKVILPIATLLMAFFTGLMIYAWDIGASIDCGCFGALVERSPGEAAVEDAVMLAMLLLAWWRLRGDEVALWSGPWSWTNKVVIGVFAVAIALCGARFFPELERLEESDLQAVVRLIGLSPKGVDVDLSEGKYLVELFSPVCGHCIQAVPKLNAMVADGTLPRIIALTNFAQDSPQIQEFKSRFFPQFEIATISLTDFYRLTYAHGYPRMAYVKDGIVQSVWERDFFPNLQRLQEITR